MSIAVTSGSNQIPVKPGKTILLVDIDSNSCDARAKMLRSLGATVHCATGASTGLSQYQAGVFNLVLIDLGRDKAGAQEFADQIRTHNPRQLVAFFVGGPKYLSLSLKGSHVRPGVERGVQASAAPIEVRQPDFGERVRIAEAEAELASAEAAAAKVDQAVLDDESQ